MIDQRIKIQYLFHSGFSVEIKDRLFIFDYMEGEINSGGKKTFVFSSHSHHDHFNPVIFDWQKVNQDIKYILSDDIPVPERKSNIYSIAPDEEIQVEGVKIKAYGSTDLGVSFLVRWAEVTLFHAGDLNWWYWWDDSPEEIKRAEKDYKYEISKIKGQAIDVAFFPVDPRLEHNFSLGADYFIQEIVPRILIPMHFGEDTEVPGQYAAKMKENHTKIMVLSKRGEEIILL